MGRREFACPKRRTVRLTPAHSTHHAAHRGVAPPGPARPRATLRIRSGATWFRPSCCPGRVACRGSRRPR